jgi:hypothetical protein
MHIPFDESDAMVDPLVFEPRPEDVIALVFIGVDDLDIRSCPLGYEVFDSSPCHVFNLLDANLLSI